MTDPQPLCENPEFKSLVERLYADAQTAGTKSQVASQLGMEASEWVAEIEIDAALQAVKRVQTYLEQSGDTQSQALIGVAVDKLEGVAASVGSAVEKAAIAAADTQVATNATVMLAQDVASVFNFLNGPAS